MVDPFLQRCLDAPLNTAERANHIWLPEGRKAAPVDDTARLLTASRSRLKAESNKRADVDRRAQLLDYYATTQVPVERVARHLKLKIREARSELKKRGRAA